jgi:hypothetical protein
LALYIARSAESTNCWTRVRTSALGTRDSDVVATPTLAVMFILVAAIS